jgi:two-component system, NarL family, response regulator LiaR
MIGLYQKIRLLIVDDHAIVREGLQTLLGEEHDIEIIGQAANGREALYMAMQCSPDVILIDLMMPEMGGIEAIRHIHAESPHTQIVVLTNFSEGRHVNEALEAGAIGYLLKDVLKPELLRAVRAAAQGKSVLHQEVRHTVRRHDLELSPHSRLTDREMSVLRLIAHGYSNKKIATTLQLTEGTVKGYVSLILEKLNVEDRTGAAIYALKHRVIAE